MKKLPNGFKHGKWLFFALIMPLILIPSILLKHWLLVLWQIMYAAAVFMWYREHDQHMQTLDNHIKFLTTLNDSQEEMLTNLTNQE